ncbi:MAG TPA: 23S rRNA (uracil(1939)-C(5))-methyltransferase RlmD, partial [Clostridiaceae bacterium]|nr:23S rRNA (uracil(1939)-C(5))-methyltransferase RlmD [Clostridiaceae bacterium]
MKNICPVEKNKEYVVDVHGMGYEGEGVSKIDNFTVFIPGALENEKVKIRIVKINKNFGFGKLMEVLEPSPDRAEPECGIYKRCGGCQLQHLSYGAQLKFKKNRVEDCLRRIGKLEGFILHDTIGMDNPYRYRNKVQIPVGSKDGKAAIGFYAQRSHDIIDMDSCLIQNETADRVIGIVRRWVDRHNIEAYDEQRSSGTLRNIMVREGFRTGEVMVVMVTRTKQLPHWEELVAALKDGIPGLKSVIQNINPKQTNVILTDECVTLWGSNTISDYIGEFRFNISPLSFFQVNPVQTEVLYSKALEYAGLTGNETVFDAYCGTGTITLFLSKKAKKVYGVEIVPQAIENARINAEQNGVENAEFIVGEAEKVIPDLIKQGVKADVVVVDPPRKGCGIELLEAIAGIAPKRIVYVSCDP